MARYIDADELVEYMERNREIEEKGNGVCENILDSECFNCFIDAIKSRLTANVQEVIHSKWRWSGSGRRNDCYTCLNCGGLAQNDTNFCPHCGARMDGEVE